jgi:hypothetical protein
VTETQAPDPTHIEVRHLDENFIIPISDFKHQFVFINQIPLYSNIDVVFLKETISGYLKLSVASLTVR